MSSGDTLCIFTPAGATFPSSNAPTFDTIATSLHLELDFDDTTDETAYWQGVLARHYGGGGVTVYVWWSHGSAGSGSNGIQWEVAFERHQADTTDLDANSFAAVQSGNSLAPTTAGVIQVTSITFTNGSQMDSLAAGESFRLKVNRDAGYASDISGDARLHRIEIKET